MTKEYLVNEIFYSLQGEGRRAGRPTIFVRFAQCNLTCNLEEHGFDCDTEFRSYIKMTKAAILQRVMDLTPTTSRPRIIFTGGEPSLQLDQPLVDFCHEERFPTGIETNGTKTLPQNLGWVCVSPKTAEHTIVVKVADEVKYVRNYGQGIPKPTCQADSRLISPSVKAEGLDRETLQWCIDLVKNNPTWTLSVQQHKIWKVR